MTNSIQIKENISTFNLKEAKLEEQVSEFLSESKKITTKTKFQKNLLDCSKTIKSIFLIMFP
jgi:hypothetical protein